MAIRNVKNLKHRVLKAGIDLVLQNAINEYKTSRPITMYESEIPETVRHELEYKILITKI